MAQTPTEMPTGPGARFFIQSAMNYGRNNGGYWDVPGVFQPNMAISRGSNIQVYDWDVHHDRYFTLYTSSVPGYYEIQVGLTNETRIDIQGAKGPTTPNGSKVQVWDRTDLTNQRFLFHHLGNGRFKIFDQNSGKVLCLAGRSSVNRSNVHLWDNHDGPWMEWYLIDVKTRQPFTPGPVYIESTPPLGASNIVIQNLEPNEQLVYGRLGLNDDGSVKYTFAMIRKPNSNKQIYRREMDMPYGPQPLIGGGQMKIENSPKEYDMFDYYVVFNGEKIGPYDRIYDIHQNEGDIDKWITPDGKHISFAGVRGQKYFPVFGNKHSGVSFWSVMQAPSYDPTSSKTTYTMQWAKDDSRLVENGSIKLKGWKDLREVRYSENGNDLLYVGAKDSKDEKFIYLNHQQIDGPYNLVRHIGFLKGTNKPYYNASKMVVIDNFAHYATTLQFGDRKFEFAPKQNVSNPTFAHPWVIFTVETKNNSYTGNDIYKKSSIEIWEYNYSSDELRKHGGVAFSAGVQKVGNAIYYVANDSDGSTILIAHGGKTLETISSDKRGKDGIIAIRLSPNGDIFTYYRNSFSAPFHLFKNGKPFALQGVDKIMGVEILDFCPSNGKVNMVINKDQSVGSEDRLVVNGNFQFNIKGRAIGNMMHFAEQGNDVFSVVEFKRGDDRDFSKQIYKNGKPISDLIFYSIVHFTISPDASRYAALVTLEKHNEFMGQYFTENQYMHNKRKLLVDGIIVDGTFGAPVWSKAKNKFLVLKQEGNSIRLVEL
jgi:hypothetical protein